MNERLCLCRTARADNPGTALSFISHTETEQLSEVEEALTGGTEDVCDGVTLQAFTNVYLAFSSNGHCSCCSYCLLSGCAASCCELWDSVCSDNSESVLRPYEFKMEEIEGFRYRCRVSVLCYLRPLLLEELTLSSADVVCARAGRHALGDEAGGEGGPAEGDQTGAAQLGEAEGERSSQSRSVKEGA